MPDKTEHTDKKGYNDKLREITESIENGIKELYESEKYKKYLKTMSRFHKYSVNNTMLIYMQKPDATYVAGYDKWKRDFKRFVKGGEKGIRIIAPSSYVKRVSSEVKDPVTNKTVLDSAGLPVMETREIKVPAFRAATVFDISQTSGEPLPTITAELTGNVKDYGMFIEAVKRSSSVPVAFDALPAVTDGFYSHDDKKITLREGMSEVQTVCALIHEIAHSKLHDRYGSGVDDRKLFTEAEVCGVPALYSRGRVDQSILPEGMYKYELRCRTEEPEVPVSLEVNVGVNYAGSVITAKPLPVQPEDFIMFGENEKFTLHEGEKTLRDFWIENRKGRSTEEIEAESISYVVCNYYGIDTSANSFGYIASWSKDKDLKELRESLMTISRTASNLITSIDGHVAELTVEKEKEENSVKKEPSAEMTEKEAGKKVPEDECLSLKSGRVHERFSVVGKLYEYQEEDRKSGSEPDKSKTKEKSTELTEGGR